MRWAHLLFAVLFGYAVVVQFNDMDWVVWAALYGLCAATCFVAFTGRGSLWPMASVLAMAGLGGALWLAPRVLGKQHLFESEEGREFLGLLVVFVWMTVLWFPARRRASRKTDG